MVSIPLTRLVSSCIVTFHQMLQHHQDSGPCLRCQDEGFWEEVGGFNGADHGDVRYGVGFLEASLTFSGSLRRKSASLWFPEDDGARTTKFLHTFLLHSADVSRYLEAILCKT